MSHFVSVTTQIKDIAALRSACAELELTLLQNAQARGYYENKTKGDFVIRLKGPYDIAVNKQPDGTFGLTADMWQGEVEKEVGEKYGKLLQLYGVHKATLEARKKGCLCFGARNPTGPSNSFSWGCRAWMRIKRPLISKAPTTAPTATRTKSLPWSSMANPGGKRWNARIAAGSGRRFTLTEHPTQIIMNRTIEIIIAPTGEIQIDAVGFKGPDCEKATKFLEEALGNGPAEGKETRVAPAATQNQPTKGRRMKGHRKRKPPGILNRGSLLTYQDEGRERCLGYLFEFPGHGIFEPTFGKLEVTSEEAKTHNQLLSQGEIEGLDKHCGVGMGGMFYTQENRPPDAGGHLAGRGSQPGRSHPRAGADLPAQGHDLPRPAAPGTKTPSASNASSNTGKGL